MDSTKTQTIQAIIIDDEKRARVLLQAILDQHCPEVNIIGSYPDLETGVSAIKKAKPDLIFLDIELPTSSGLQILDFFEEDEVDFSIIFVTAYSDYAIQAFRLSAIDYVLKPIHSEKLKEAIDHFKSVKTKQYKQLEALKSNLYERKKKIVIPSRDDFQFIEPEEILYVKADGSYCQFVLKNGKKILMSRNLKHVEELTEDFDFMQRVHKSFLINMNEIHSFQRGNAKVILSDQTEIPISSDRIGTLGMK